MDRKKKYEFGIVFLEIDGLVGKVLKDAMGYLVLKLN
jgi:hypothetical protein